MGKRKHVSRKEQRKLKRVKQKEDKHAHFVEQHTRQRRETDQTSMMAPPEHKAGRPAQPNKKQKKKRKETATRARFSSEEELDPDDEEIAYLEKQLGIKKNPDKIKAVQREMVQEDGYDSDFVGWFEDIRNMTKQTKTSAPSDQPAPPAREEEVSEDEDDKEIKYLQKKLGIQGGKMGAKFRRELAQEEGFEEDFIEWLEETTGAPAGTKDASSSSDSESDTDDSAEEDTTERQQYLYDKKPNVAEIYGQHDSTSGTTAVASAGYVPPHLRSGTDARGVPTSADRRENTALARRVQGLLNRLGADNIEPIVSDLVALYEDHSTAKLNDVLVPALLQGGKSKISACPSAAVVVALSVAVGGVAIIAAVVENAIDEIARVCDLGTENATASDEPVATPDGENELHLFSFLGYMYLFGGICPELVTDVMKQLIDRWSVVNIDRTLATLDACGTALRAEAPSSIREIIEGAQAQAVARRSSARASEMSLRSQIFLEKLHALKNNRRSGGVSGGDSERLLKWLRYFQGKTDQTVPTLRVSLEDILKRSEKGRWWIVGASWSSVAPADATGTQAPPDSSGKQKEGLAVTKKEIMAAIMGGHDYEDALERISKLPLKGRQQGREVIRVLFDCNGRCKQFNPYFAFLAARLCDLQPGHKFTITLQLWDLWKAMEGKKTRTLSNSAKFFAHLVGTFQLSLAVCKVIEWRQMGKEGTLFFLVFVGALMQTLDAPTLFSIFDRVSGESSDHQIVKRGFKWFMKKHLLGRSMASKYDTDNVRAVMRALNRGLVSLE